MAGYSGSRLFAVTRDPVRHNQEQEVAVAHESIELKKREIEQLCRQHSVRRLDLFGSAVSDRFDLRSSDVDVLVEFDTGPGFDYFGTYFDLKEGLSGSWVVPRISSA